MKTPDLIKRTAIRLSATLASLFTLLLLGLYLGLTVYIGAQLEKQIGARMRETRDALVIIDRTKGYDELASTIQDEAAAVSASGSIFLLLDESGSVVAGNVKSAPAVYGMFRIEGGELGTGDGKEPLGGTYVAEWTQVSRGRLLVGIGDAEVRETLKILRHATAWGTLLTLAIVLAASLNYARRAQRRIDALEETLTAVSRGCMDRRVPVAGYDDDIDHVAVMTNDALNHLQKLIDNVNQSSSDIAHDLKKPIGRLQYQLETTLREARDIAEYRRAILNAQDKLAEITATFEAILRISQIEAGARKTGFQVLDLNELMTEVGEIYDVVIEDRGGRFQPAAPLPAPALILGDRQLLVQLFANLIENAIRHAPPECSISLSLARQDGAYVASVSDTGAGIPASERENVFKRMYRLDKSRTSEGSGLGLSLVAAIAELHSAKVTLGDAAPGLLVTVHFAMPPPSVA